jgi:hypothetical protein
MQQLQLGIFFAAMIAFVVCGCILTRKLRKKLLGMSILVYCAKMTSILATARKYIMMKHCGSRRNLLSLAGRALHFRCQLVLQL